MKNKPKPELRQQDVQRIIGEVTATDRDRARQAIAAGVQAAQAQWLEAPLVAEALALELIAVLDDCQSATATAAFLRSLAANIETPPKRH